MKTANRYLLALLLFLLCGAHWQCKPKKETNWEVDFENRQSKQPYGLYLAYERLKLLYPHAETKTLDKAYSLTRLNARLANEDDALIILVGGSLSITDDESDSLISLIDEGKTVLISCMQIPSALTYRLELMQSTPSLYAKDASQCIHFEEEADTREYCYRGQNIMSYFSTTQRDSGQSLPYYIIGSTSEKGPDFIVYQIGKGKLFLHASPFVFTNYFLLQNNNHTYIDKLLKFMPNTGKVLWMNFDMREAKEYNRFGGLFRDKATRAFLLVALGTLLVYVLFEMKRRQKIIPFIEPNTNTSVAFVETVGRLYFNTGDNGNLARKMAQHFLEYVRTHYFISTNAPDEEFEHALAAKSGISREKVHALVNKIALVNASYPVDETFLIAFYNDINEFYSQ